jgi:2-aminomuconate deaminase
VQACFPSFFQKDLGLACAPVNPSSLHFQGIDHPKCRPMAPLSSCPHPPPKVSPTTHTLALSTHHPPKKTIYISGTSSRRGDGTYAGFSTSSSGTFILDIREQTAAVLENIGTIIKGATEGKCGLESVVDATVFLTDMKDYAGMNEVWNKVFPVKTNAPARTTVQVAALPSEKLCVEIKCTAIVVERN